jgi:AhpD family alkylhydroperoxidase
MAIDVQPNRVSETTLTTAELELASIGASVGAGCQPCLEHHLRAGREAGLSSAQLLQALADAECVKRSAYNQLAAHGRSLLGESVEEPADCCSDSNRAKEFVSIGSAIGANSLANLDKHVAAAKAVGLSEAQIAAAIKVAQSVQRHAASVTADAAAALVRSSVPASTKEPIWLTSPSATEQSACCGPSCGCKSE